MEMIRKMNVPEQVCRILQILREAGSPAYLVGGCVRDCLLGRKPHDWDICTAAPVGQLKVLFKEKGYGVAPTGLQHGTLTVIDGGRPYEITVFRKKRNVFDKPSGETEIFSGSSEARKGRMQSNVFDKPSGEAEIFSDSPEARKGRMQSNVFDKPSGETEIFSDSPEARKGRMQSNIPVSLDENPLFEDLGLRDFTVNSIAWNMEEGLIDPYGGVQDVSEGVLRCAGSAVERMREDPLRILRALRFAARLGFTVDASLREAIHAEVGLLGNVAVERITSELYRFMHAPGGRIAALLREYADVFCAVMPELKPMIGFDQQNPHHSYDVWEHTMRAMEACTGDDVVLKFTILFHDMGKPHTFTVDNQGIGHFYGHAEASCRLCAEIMNRLRFDNKTMAEVHCLVEVHDARVEVQTRSIRRWLNRLGLEQFERLLQMKRCDAAGQNPVYWPERKAYIDSLESCLKEVLAQDACFSMKDLAVKGSDLIAVGYEKGSVLGKCLQRLLDEVLDERLPNEKDILLARAISWLHQDARLT